MIVAVSGSCCFAISCKINHLAINPVRGGSPPRERRARAVVDTKIGVFDHMVVTVLILVADVIFRDRKAVDVMNRYMPRASRVRWGAYCEIIIIQPICAMEE
ncbi:MAG: hypothetical protein ACRC9O_11550 [Plesiomonas sp.]|uniref:hypothetical protein n=1 Tax=Plesiomonas sp. TaxID=2486279 RepID=UPI003F3C4072